MLEKTKKTPKINNNMIKKISIWFMNCLILYVVLYGLIPHTVYAAQSRQDYNSSTFNSSKYPGYKELLDKLKAVHPNWNFTILYTGLDWNNVIKNETVARHGRSLVTASKPSSWFCSICGNKAYDNGSWRCASEGAVSYYMDPRNSLNEDYIFQFEALSYNEAIQTIDGVNQIIKDVGYMQGNTITYTKTDGTQGTINKSYAQVIMEAAKEANVSPYHLASRIRQEQGTGSSPSALASGTYSGYTGYYNFFNIRASGSGSTQIIQNGLNYAKSQGWTDPEKAIKGGANFLAKDYISNGQDTLYLQKYDVDDSDGSLYSYQYMQNIAAAKSEGYSVKQSYSNMGLLDSSINFIIPVYENMPTETCKEPGTENIVTQDVKIKGTKVNVREGKSTSSNVLATVNTGDVLLRIEIASQMENGYYWDKVVLPDGRKGYLARNYIVEIADITNCNDTAMTNTSVNLRNGPGTTGTTVITTLMKGQMVTRIETGKYELDGYKWDRVVLADGRKGYIAQNYIDIVNGGNSGGTATGEIIKVICPSGLKVREQPGTDKRVLTYLDSGDTLTRVEKNVSNSNGYNWDKIVTAEGVEGYIASGNASETYIEVVSSGETPSTDPTTPTGTNDNCKIEEGNLVCEPATSIETIQDKYTDKKVVVKKPDGTVIESGKLGTGYTVTVESKTYTVVKMGDINGDASIDTLDSLKVLRNYVGSENLENQNLKAADINNDGTVDTLDSLKILRQYVGSENIEISD